MRFSSNSFARYARHSKISEGFTVVELAIVITVFSILSSLVIFTLGDFYESNTSSVSKSVQSTNTRSVLRAIEDDLVSTTGWATTLPVVRPLGPTNDLVNLETWSYCGTGGTSNCTQSVNRVLIAYTTATDKAPSDSTRLPVFANTMGSCTPDGTLNTIKVASIYFVALDTSTSKYNLYRRTVVNPASGTICNGVVPYQNTTCATSVSSQPVCKDASNNSHTDAVLLTNIQSFTVDYYTQPNDTSPVTNEYTAPAASITNATTIKITVGTQSTVNGQQTTVNADLRVVRQ
jgi:prepilin-type N-terminal cleavage/methylation domain-containing protein